MEHETVYSEAQLLTMVDPLNEQVRYSCYTYEGATSGRIGNVQIAGRPNRNLLMDIHTAKNQVLSKMDEQFGDSAY